MIAVIGDASLLFRQTESDVFKCEVSGYGYHVARNLAERKAFPALFAPLGSDRAREIIAEDIVLSEILFDPSLFSLPYKTNLEIIYNTGAYSDFFSSSASAFLDSETLRDALSIHTNITTLHISSRLLSVNPAAASVVDGALSILPRPLIVLDLNERIESSVLMKAAEALLPYLGAVIMNDDTENAEIIRKAELSLVRKNGNLVCFRSGREEKIFKIKEIKSNAFASELLYFLDSSASGNSITLSLLEEFLQAL